MYFNLLIPYTTNHIVCDLSYGTNHPQLKRHTRVTRVCVACVPRVQKQKTSVASNHSCTRVCTHLHACKMNAPHTRTYPYEVSAMKRLLTTSSALSFIIYACRTILGGIVTDILGVPRNTAFVAPCS